MKICVKLSKWIYRVQVASQTTVRKYPVTQVTQWYFFITGNFWITDLFSELALF